MKSMAEQDVDNVVKAYAIGGVDGANKEFAEVCKGLRFFECLMLARMVREKIDFTELKMV